MDKTFKQYLLKEEKQGFKGWDFSYLHGRWKSELIPWDYKEIIYQYLKSDMHLLDMGTGGGEFLLSLKHPFTNTTVTEGYLPNIKLCLEILKPKGITVVEVEEGRRLPFSNEMFDIIINRHESFCVQEVYRILKPGGIFITQQVGDENNKDLSCMLIDNYVSQCKDFNLTAMRKKMKKLAFDIISGLEAFTPIYFYDTGALVYFAKIISWEFPNFSVEKCFEKLQKLDDIRKDKGYIRGMEHRFLIVAKKEITYK